MTPQQAVAPDRPTGAAAGLPPGFTVRIRDDVRRLPAPDGSLVLVGGSPLRALRLAPAAAELVQQGRLTVAGPVGVAVARRLLDGNLADPARLPAVPPEDVTVVVPVRDRADQLGRCLTALAGLRVLVVDDASRDRAAVADVASRHGATLVGLETNRGPAAARNAGLAQVMTPYVAFVDSDVTVGPEVLCELAGHFADPRVALVGPLVRGRSRSRRRRPRWFEAYDVHASSLSLGRRACSVRPRAAVGWLPSACVVGRVDALRASAIGGFAEELRVGEDVDLVWRLNAAGHSVRYEPALAADHDVRSTMRGWLGRKVVYGTGSAELGRRHGDAVAPAALAPAMAVAAAALLARRRWSAPVAAVGLLWGTREVAAALPDVPGRVPTAAALSTRGLGWALRQEAALLLRHWWPAALVASLLSRRVRRAVVSAVLVDSVVALVEQPRPGPVVRLLGRRLDDLAYGLGLWQGAVRSRDLSCLAVRVTRRGGREAAPAPRPR